MSTQTEKLRIRLLEITNRSKPEDLFPALTQAAAELVTSDPFAFLLGACINRGTKAEIIWQIPQDMKQALGHLDPAKIMTMSQADLVGMMDNLDAKTRYPYDAAKTVADVARITVEKYGGHAERLWEGRTAAEVKAELLTIYGVGEGIASMTVILIERAWPVRFEDLDRPAMDIKPDVNTRRVLHRLGLITLDEDSEAAEAQAIAAARKLNPAWPGELDTALWLIARRNCVKKQQPKCGTCPVRQDCRFGESMTPKEDLTWSTIKVRIGDLVDWEHNPVQLTRHEAESIEASIDKFNLAIPFVANAPMADGRRRLIDGHQRKTVLLAARKVGPATKIDVRVPSRPLTEKECDELTIRLRKNTGEWDMDKLANFFETGDLLEWGFTKHELVGFDIDPEGATAPDVPMEEAAALREKWGVTKGQIWEAGLHRILCGDSLKAESWQRLMDGEKAAMINVDPPYGVNYDPNILGPERHERVENDNLTGDALIDFLVVAFNQMMKITLPGCAWYVWHGYTTFEAFQQATKRVGIEIRQIVTWIKPAATLGRMDYQQGYEPCIYGSKVDDRPHWYGGRDESTVWNVAASQDGKRAVTIANGILVSDGHGHQLYLKARAPKGKKIRTVHMEDGQTVEVGTDSETSDVWMVGRDTHPLHPTQKPVELATKALHNSTLQGDVVVDGFAGAGFTVVGCELMKRAARAIEQDPKYVAIILERLSLMGLDPKPVKAPGAPRTE